MSATRGFLDDDFLLSSPIACDLYQGFAADAPIVDVHNHLSPREIATDHVFADLDELWLAADHYKWRAMRQAGVDEALITGNPDPWDRFEAWASCLPGMVGNPLYVWTHLELRRVFDIDLTLSADTAREIWQEANAQLSGLGSQRVLRSFDVRVVATTDDPTSDLAHHSALRKDGGDLSMIPTFRPDPAHGLLGDPAAWNEWVDALAAANDRGDITDLSSLLAGLTASFHRMAALGSRASDHGLACLPDRAREPQQADAVIRNARSGRPATAEERELVLLEVVALAARLACENDSVLQLHLGPLRNVSPRLLEAHGVDAGADVIGDKPQAGGLTRFLGELERTGELPRTVLYNLNPADNMLFAAAAGAFARPGIASLVQWGPPWWFNDQETGIRTQLDTLQQVGRLGSFIGMLTDSRSILSMTRHELFRRILCDELGRQVATGTVPNDVGLLGPLVRRVAHDNAVEFFGLP